MKGTLSDNANALPSKMYNHNNRKCTPIGLLLLSVALSFIPIGIKFLIKRILCLHFTICDLFSSPDILYTLIPPIITILLDSVKIQTKFFSILLSIILGIAVLIFTALFTIVEFQENHFPDLVIDKSFVSIIVGAFYAFTVCVIFIFYLIMRKNKS